MKVWVVLESDYDAEPLCSIASTRELAEDWIIRERLYDWEYEIVRKDEQSLVYMKKTTESGYQFTRLFYAEEWTVDP